MAKGSKEALLVMDRLTLVLGVPNRTVITVMEPHERENTVFTNIDSVVMVAKGVPLAQ
jgi:flagellar operon protein